MGWTIVIVLCAAIGQLLSYNWQNKEQVGSVTKNRIFLAATVLIIVSTIGQFWHTNRKMYQKDTAATNEQIRRERIAQNHYDSSLKANSLEQTAVFTEILAKYGYKLDSVNNVLLTVDPVFQLCSNDIDGILVVDGEHGEKKLKLRLCSKDAGVGGFQIHIVAVVKSKTIGLEYQITEEINEPTYKLSTGSWFEQEFKLEKYNDISKVYILLKGIYWKTDKTKNYQVEELYFFDMEKKDGRRYGFTTGVEKKEVMSVIYAGDPSLWK